MHRFVHIAPAGLLSAVFLLAGCSSSGGSPSAGTPPPASPGVVTLPTVPGGSPADEGGANATCKQLTFDEVQPLLDVPITTVAVSPFGLSGSTGQECRFDGADAAYSVDVIVDGGSNAMLEYNSDVTGFASPAPLPGVGDQAMWDKGNESSSFAAIKGDVYCTVNGDDEDMPGVGALMNAANNTLRIGDANWQIIAAAYATLCNRIYGSGNTTIDLSGLAPGPAVSADPDLP